MSAALALLLAGCARPSAARLTGDGNQAYARGDYNAALEDYLKAEVERPELSGLNYNAGNTLSQQGSYAQAITESLRATDAGSTDVRERAYYAIGADYFNEGKLAEALDAYKSALRLDPNDLDAKYNVEVIQRRLAKEAADRQSLQQNQQNQQQSQQDQQQGQQGQSAQQNPQGDQSQQGQQGQTGQQQGQPGQQGQSAQPAGQQGQSGQQGGQSQQAGQQSGQAGQSGQTGQQGAAGQSSQAGQPGGQQGQGAQGAGQQGVPTQVAGQLPPGANGSSFGGRPGQGSLQSGQGAPGGQTPVLGLDPEAIRAEQAALAQQLQQAQQAYAKAPSIEEALHILDILAQQESLDQAARGSRTDPQKQDK